MTNLLNISKVIDMDWISNKIDLIIETGKDGFIYTILCMMAIMMVWCIRLGFDLVEFLFVGLWP